MDKPVVRISVRNLVEFILRSGDLDNRGGSSDREAMQKGSRLHRKIQGRMGSHYRAEVSLKYKTEYEDVSIQVEGRADGIFTEDGQCWIDEIKGVYVPFWLFDTDVDAQVRYRATKVRTWSDSDYDYTETSHFMVHRGGSVGFEHVPVDGSSKMADDLMESIEPYNISDAVHFQTAYLAGYVADKYDVTAEESVDRANQRVKRSTEEVFAETVKGYTTVTPENTNVQFHGGKARYALYPVWLLNTTWNGNQYVFAMNGQTGKFVGDLPVDKAAAKRWTFLLAAIFSVASYGVAWGLHLIGLI